MSTSLAPPSLLLTPRKRTKLSSLDSTELSLIYQDLLRFQGKVVDLDLEDDALQRELEAVLEKMRAKLMNVGKVASINTISYPSLLSSDVFGKRLLSSLAVFTRRY